MFAHVWREHILVHIHLVVDDIYYAFVQERKTKHIAGCEDHRVNVILYGTIGEDNTGLRELFDVGLDLDTARCDSICLLSGVVQWVGELVPSNTSCGQIA